MEKQGIKGRSLSHNQAMEQEKYQDEVSTKEQADYNGVYLTKKDAEEYGEYKRRKKYAEINKAVSSSLSTTLWGEDTQRVCGRAIRLKQCAVKVPLTQVSQAYYYLLGYKVGIDCVVGLGGETLGKVKAYESRIALRKKANAITLILTPSLIDCCRYGEARKEIKKVKRAIGKNTLTVRVEKSYPQSTLSRLARLVSETGAKYFSVPYFKGCERLKADLFSGCGLEVTGVETEEIFRFLSKNGVDRIVSNSVAEIQASWLKEVESERFLSETEKPKEPPLPAQTKGEGYLCQGENGEWKFV